MPLFTEDGLSGVDKGLMPLSTEDGLSGVDKGLMPLSTEDGLPGDDNSTNNYWGLYFGPAAPRRGTVDIRAD